ncbi:dihydroorotate oxidase B, electron transfer subunit [Desulfovibrio litoralis DSM 11393]|uniref:Dihydroorotate oxidase B, electron transfer subunit n=2 Tax=Desulfovibrio litoralis TaxID=466107 RepID=A0A1M7T458_9BACT|nr:dihydroorotate dehydrogenase [Desulfovibrio litoralis]SHN65533.1 dihydroorotate oxidase B, electron transfer subunit [Desulfovibrio litoralis DSM 11393]
MNTQACQELKVLDLVQFGQNSGGAKFFALRLSSPLQGTQPQGTSSQANQPQAGNVWEKWKPGQFVMLRPVNWGFELVTARPFSISTLNDNSLTVFIQVLGRGTERLLDLKIGDAVTVWGPLGTGFATEPNTSTLILAGGVGLAPFVGYIRQHPTPNKIRLEFCHRLPVTCYPFDTLAEKVHADSHQELSVEDREPIFKHLEDIIQSYAANNGLILACGPTPFLKRIQELASKYKARCQLSVETRMACGVGACLGCVVEATGKGKIQTETGKLQACMHGPVFWADEIDFNPKNGEAL